MTLARSPPSLPAGTLAYGGTRRWVLQGSIIREQQAGRDGRLCTAALRQTRNGGECSSMDRQPYLPGTTPVLSEVGVYQG